MLKDYYSGFYCVVYFSYFFLCIKCVMLYHIRFVYVTSVCLSVLRRPALLGYCLFWQPATFLVCCLLETALANKD